MPRQTCKPMRYVVVFRHYIVCCMKSVHEWKVSLTSEFSCNSIYVFMYDLCIQEIQYVSIKS